MPAPRLDFWFDFASTYSHPAALTIGERAQAVGVEVEWRPFLLGPLFHAQQGLTDSPFNVQREKGAYMWRDLERTCARVGVPWRKPSAFPRRSLLASRTALALEESARPVFARAVFRANFAEDRDIADPAVLAEAVRQAGGDPRDAATAAGSDAVKAALRSSTEAAVAAGLFGAPSFTTDDGELFWGFDRMDEALRWAVDHAQT